MHRTAPFPVSVLRFRRWCRKGYAVFCSLGRCVCIGRVSASIADASLKKQVQPADRLSGNGPESETIVRESDSGNTVFEMPSFVFPEPIVLRSCTAETAGAARSFFFESTDRNAIATTALRSSYFRPYDTKL